MSLYQVTKTGVGDVRLVYEASASTKNEAQRLELANLTDVNATFEDGETTVTEIESPNGRKAEVYIMQSDGTWFIEDRYVVDGDAPTWADAERAAVDYAERKWYHANTVFVFKGWVKI